jgi:hypothetical protein
MNITIKNLKVAEFASHETLCFKCTVYVDGKRAFTAENQGQGGCNFYHPVKGQTYAIVKKAEAYAATVETEFDFEQLDILLDGLISTGQIENDVKKILKKVAFFDGTNIRTFKAPANQLGLKGEPSTYRDLIAKKYPTAIILNDLPLDEAVALYRSAA